MGPLHMARLWWVQYVISKHKDTLLVNPNNLKASLKPVEDPPFDSFSNLQIFD